MKVILLQDVKKQGKKDEIINVSDGYAKNFLIAKGLAVPLNDTNKKHLDASIDKKKRENDKLLEDALKLKKDIEKETIKFKLKQGENGKLFGSISTKQISDELKKKNYNIDKNKIKCDHLINSLGSHIVEINLHKDVVAKINIIVE